MKQLISLFMIGVLGFIPLTYGENNAIYSCNGIVKVTNVTCIEIQTDEKHSELVNNRSLEMKIDKLERLKEKYSIFETEYLLNKIKRLEMEIQGKLK